MRTISTAEQRHSVCISLASHLALHSHILELPPMSHPHPVIHPRDVLQTITSHKRLLAAPIVVLTAVAVGYAIVRPKTWEAAQAMVVRSESSDTLSRLGRATELEQMKSTQETILELAKSRDVLLGALQQAGPGSEDNAANWPNEKALEALQDSVAVEPPKGAEFGKTELFYLKVKDHDRTRSTALASAISTELQSRLANMQKASSEGSIKELDRSVKLAQEELSEATKRLSAMEQHAGNDLVELRILTESPSGDSDLRRNLVELEKELRVHKAAQLENEESLRILKEAESDPAKLMAAPSLLLKSQPALARLKDGLVDAQLRSGQALGTMSEDHPMVRGAREAERVIRNQLHDEIALAIKGVAADQQVGADRIKSVESQIAEVQQRLSRLADMRAEYANLSDAVKSRSETLKAVEHELADAKARNAAANATSRLNLVGTPDTGTRPIGPGRSVIAAGGLGAGLLVSAAIAFLLIQPAPTPTSAAAVVEQPTVGEAVNTLPTPVPLAAVSPPTAEPVAELPMLRLAENSAKPAGRLSLSKALQRVAG